MENLSSDQISDHSSNQYSELRTPDQIFPTHLQPGYPRGEDVVSCYQMKACLLAFEIKMNFAEEESDEKDTSDVIFLQKMGAVLGLDKLL